MVVVSGSRRVARKKMVTVGCGDEKDGDFKFVGKRISKFACSPSHEESGEKCLRGRASNQHKTSTLQFTVALFIMCLK